MGRSDDRRRKSNACVTRLRLRQPFFDSRQGSAGSEFAGGNQLGGALESVVAEAPNIRGQHQVGGRLPDSAHLLLRYREALSDDVEDVTWSAQIYPVRAEVNAHDTLRSHFAERNCGHRVRQHPIHQQFATDVHRQEHAWVSATGADRIDKRTGRKHGSVSCNEVGSRNCQRNPEFLEGSNFKHLLEKADHAIVRGDPVPRYRPTRKVLETYQRGDFLEFFGGDAAAIRCANHGSDAGSGNKVDRNAFFFENFEDADMGESAGKPAAECDSDRRKLVRQRLGLGDWPGPTDFPCKSSKTTSEFTDLFQWPETPHPGKHCKLQYVSMLLPNRMFSRPVTSVPRQL